MISVYLLLDQFHKGTIKTLSSTVDQPKQDHVSIP